MPATSETPATHVVQSTSVQDQATMAPIAQATRVDNDDDHDDDPLLKCHKNKLKKNKSIY